MEAAEIIHTGAGTLSTFGLYAIVAALALIIVHLYKRVNQLETEFRDSLISQTERIAKNNAEMQALVVQTQDIIKANTVALQEFIQAFSTRI